MTETRNIQQFHATDNLGGFQMTYRESREAKAERLREWAGKREQRAEAQINSNPETRHDIAFITQPGHIPARARMIAADERAFESLGKAREMESRASNIEAQLSGSIYSDDPDAIEQLQARIAGLEAERDRVKRYNATCRKGAPDLSILDDTQRRDLLGMIRVWGDIQCKGGAFPGYHLTGLSSNINRNKKRLEQLQRQVS